jgi:hypothetical protein
MSEDRTKEVLATLIAALRLADQDGTYGWLSYRARSLIGTALMSIDGPVDELIKERDAAVSAYDLLL